MRNNSSIRDDSPIKVDNLILGGGVSGIFFGQELLQRNLLNFLILEKEDRLGGLCRSFKMGGLYYDIGAHALHKKAIEISTGLGRYIDINKLYCQKRNAKVFIFQKLIPYPFQLHLFYVPWRVKLKCFISYLIRPKIKSNNLSDWLQSKFGKQVCNFFLFPYNEKVWKTDLKNISTKWVSRISFGSWQFLKGLFVGGDQNYNSNDHVCYPKTGGFENLFLDSIRRLHNNYLTNSAVVKVDLKNKIVEIKNGHAYQYNNLISTLPIDILIKQLVSNNKNKIIKLVDQLEKVSTCLVTFRTLKHPSTFQRIYISDKKYLAQRIIINSNSNQYLKEQNESIFSLEISYKDENDLPKRDIIISNCKKLLRDLDIIKCDDDIKDCQIDFFKYMYPVQTINLETIMSKIKKYLGNYNCYTIGRFGSWNYANIDGMLHEAKELINEIY